MKICVVGMGAIGSLFAGWLARSGCAVSALARGATFDALRSGGLRLSSAGAISCHAIDVHVDPHALGQQDLVIVAIKGHGLRAAAASIAPLVGPHTNVLVALNGVPWWLFDRLDGAHRGRRIATLDPDGALAQAIPTANIIGCVVYPNCAVLEPGLVEHRLAMRCRSASQAAASRPGSWRWPVCWSKPVSRYAVRSGLNTTSGTNCSAT